MIENTDNYFVKINESPNNLSCEIIIELEGYGLSERKRQTIQIKAD